MKTAPRGAVFFASFCPLGFDSNQQKLVFDDSDLDENVLPVEPIHGQIRNKHKTQGIGQRGVDWAEPREKQGVHQPFFQGDHAVIRLPFDQVQQSANLANTIDMANGAGSCRVRIGIGCLGFALKLISISLHKGHVFCKSG